MTNSTNGRSHLHGEDNLAAITTDGANFMDGTKVSEAGSQSKSKMENGVGGVGAKMNGEKVTTFQLQH